MSRTYKRPAETRAKMSAASKAAWADPEPTRATGEIATMAKAKDETAAAGPEARGRPVLVTTAHRGVFFGYAEDTAGNTVKLTRARCCIYWPCENHGFMGLAADGPKKGARIGPAADIELREVTSVTECTAAAVAAWEAAPWQ